MVFFIRIIAALFFLLGAFDCLAGGKLGLSEKFRDGINAMGKMAFAMVGIYSLAPVIGRGIVFLFTPLSKMTGIDISIFSSMFLGIDLDGYKVAMSIGSGETARFSGIIVASGFGIAMSFSLPLALELIEAGDRKQFLKGFLIGLLSLLPGVIAAGFVMGIPFLTLILNVTPLIILSLFIITLAALNEKVLSIAFMIVQKIILTLCVAGFMLQGINSILEFDILAKFGYAMPPPSECFTIVGNISLFIAGIYTLMEVIDKFFKKHIESLGKRLKLNENDILCFMGNFVNNLIVFSFYGKLSERGKLLCAACSVTAVFILGGQLGYVTAVEPALLPAYFTLKCVSLLVGILLIKMRGVAMKKRISALLAILMFISCVSLHVRPVFAETETVTVIVDGRKIDFPDAPAYIDENGRTQVPTRFIGEAMGAKVTWDEEAGKVEFYRYSKTWEEDRIDKATFVDFYVGFEDYYTRIGRKGLPDKRRMDTKAFIQNERTYTPVRYLAEAFGAKVEWNGQTKTVTITSETKTVDDFVIPKSYVDYAYRVLLSDPNVVAPSDEIRPILFTLSLEFTHLSIEARTPIFLNVLSQKLGQDSLDRIAKFMKDHRELVAYDIDEYVDDFFLDSRSGQYVRIIRGAGSNSNKGNFALYIYDKNRVPEKYLR